MSTQPQPAPSQSRRLSKSPRARATLSAAHHSTVDSCLKSLRTTIRSVSALEEAIADETQLLQRLYYKGKNQHRLKPEGGKRGMVGMALEELQRAFYGGEELSNKAQRKQAWTMLPSDKLIVSTMHNLHSMFALLTKSPLAKAESIFLAAYRSFEQLMQSGYFLPLALTLVAVSSRMHSLVSEVYAELEGVSPTLQSVTSLLQCERHVPKFQPSRSKDAIMAPLPIPSTSTSVATNPNGPGLLPLDADEEDLGQTVSRPQISESFTSVDIMSMRPGAAAALKATESNDSRIGRDSSGSPMPMEVDVDNKDLAPSSPLPLQDSSIDRMSPDSSPPSEMDGLKRISTLPIAEAVPQSLKLLPSSKKDKKRSRTGTEADISLSIPSPSALLKPSVAVPKKRKNLTSIGEPEELPQREGEKAKRKKKAKKSKDEIDDIFGSF